MSSPTRRTLPEWGRDVVAGFNRIAPGIALKQFLATHALLLARGLSYQAVFTVFSGLWVAFAVFGFILRDNDALQDSIVTFLNTSVPGLIDATGTTSADAMTGVTTAPEGGGAIQLSALLSASVLGWTGAIAAIGMAFTALGWLGGGRDAVRIIMAVPQPKRIFPLLLARDLLLAIGFAAAIVASAAITIVGTDLLTTAVSMMGFATSPAVPVAIAQVGTLAVSFVFDLAALSIFYRVVSGVRVPGRILAEGAAIAALAIGVLKALGSVLLRGAGSNPLLASFAVIIGLLIWFWLVNLVLLAAASWMYARSTEFHIDLATLDTLGTATPLTQRIPVVAAPADPDPPPGTGSASP